MFPLSAVWAQGKVVEIKKHGVNICKLPSQTAEVAVKVPLGMQLESLGKSDQWLKVKLLDGKRAM